MGIDRRIRGLSKGRRYHRIRRYERYGVGVTGIGGPSVGRHIMVGDGMVGEGAGGEQGYW